MGTNQSLLLEDFPSKNYESLGHVIYFFLIKQQKLNGSNSLYAIYLVVIKKVNRKNAMITFIGRTI